MVTKANPTRPPAPSLESIPSLPTEALCLHLNSFNLVISGRCPQLIVRLQWFVASELPGASCSHDASMCRPLRCHVLPSPPRQATTARNGTTWVWVQVKLWKLSSFSEISDPIGTLLYLSIYMISLLAQFLWLLIQLPT